MHGLHGVGRMVVVFFRMVWLVVLKARKLLEALFHFTHLVSLSSNLLKQAKHFLLQFQKEREGECRHTCGLATGLGAYSKHLATQPLKQQ